VKVVRWVKVKKGARLRSTEMAMAMAMVLVWAFA